MSNKLEHKIKRNFTMVPNEVFLNHNLSYKAKGLFCQIMALPEGWDFSVKGLAKIAKENETAIKTGLKELEAAGFVEWRKYRVNNQQFAVKVTTKVPKTSCEEIACEKTSCEKTFNNKESNNKELNNKELNNINKGIYENQDSSLEPGEQVDWENLDYTLWNKI